MRKKWFKRSGKKASRASGGKPPKYRKRRGWRGRTRAVSPTRVIRVTGPHTLTYVNTEGVGYEYDCWRVFIADTAKNEDEPVKRAKTYNCLTLERAQELGGEMSRDRGMPLSMTAERN